MSQYSSNEHSKHKGRVKQIPIYLGKMFRMFVFLNDWKVIPMAAIIAALVSYVVGRNMFITMEGTIKAALALACVCLWNGCFNSIQVVCRERDIVKREHRDGMHISSYLMAHMIYQGFLCLLQTIITVAVCYFVGMKFPAEGFITPSFKVDFAITVFLITYAADMLALMISCLAKNTTAAMTIMPFLLIFQLLFSGSMFGLDGTMAKLTDMSIAKWGISCFCAQADYNSLQMVTPWNQLKKFENITIPDTDVKPIGELLNYIIQENKAADICYWMGSQNTIPDYEKSVSNIMGCWLSLIMFSLLFAVLAIIFLERVDQDKR